MWSAFLQREQRASEDVAFGLSLVGEGARHTQRGVVRPRRKQPCKGPAAGPRLACAEGPASLVRVPEALGLYWFSEMRSAEGGLGPPVSVLWCWELIFAHLWPVLLLGLPVQPASQAPVQPVSIVAGAQPAWQMLGAVLTLPLPHPLPGTWQPAGRPSTWHHLCLFLPDLGRA